MYSLENYDLKLALQRGIQFADPNGYNPQIAATFAIGDPYGTVVVGNYIYAVAAYLPGIVRKVSLSTGLGVKDIAVGNDPRGICYDGAYLWVANYTGTSTVSKIDVATDTVVATVVVGPDPVMVEYDGFASVWVACTGSTSAYKIHIATNAVTNIPLGFGVGAGAWNVAYDNRGYMCFGNRSNTSLKRVRITTNVVHSVRTSTNIYGMCSAADFIWTTNFGNKVSRIDRLNGEVTKTTVDRSPTRRPAFDGKRVWVPCGDSGYTVVIDAETMLVVAEIKTNAGSNRFVCFDASNAYISAPTGLIKVPLF